MYKYTIQRNEMKKSRKIIALLTACIMVALCFTACGGSDSKSSGEKEKITIAIQYGMAYAPLKVMKEKKLIEKHYENVEIEWATLNSGSAITEGMTSGDVQFGAMGVGPAVTAVSSGVPVKIASNVSAQPHAIMTNQDDINSLKDIDSKDKIALVNIGSFQHIVLAMAAKEQLGDAHALDDNITAMAHPDGMNALEAGSVECQLTTSPYLFKEAKMDGIHEVEALDSVWPDGNSFIVMLGTTDIEEKNPELYKAVCDGMQDAIDWINDNKDDAAELLCEDEDTDAKTMKSWLSDPACVYSTKCTGVMDFAKFMDENDFLEKDGPKSFSDLAFDNVKGN